MHYVDFSKVAIEFWRRRMEPGAALRYHHADARALPFVRSLFSFALDKGCLDALAFGKSGDPSAHVALALAELQRVLKPCGVLYSFSTDPPELRAELLRSCGPEWRVRWLELAEDDHLPECSFDAGAVGSLTAATDQATPRSIACFMYTVSL